MVNAAQERPWWHGTARRSVRRAVPEVRAAAVVFLEKMGVPTKDAETTAGHLLEGDLRGYPGQGVSRIRQIADMIGGRALDPSAPRPVRRAAPAIAIVEARRSLGPPAADEAVLAAREIAARSGVAVVGVRDAGHLGMLAPWAEKCAGEEYFSLVASASEPAVSVPGGHRRVFGTNPIAYAWPSPSGTVVADFATSAVSRSAVLSAAERGVPLAPGVAADVQGLPTRTAADAASGSILPLAPAHKGTLLCLLVAMLAGPVLGGPAAHNVTGTRGTAAPPHKVDFFLLIDLASATVREQFDMDGELLLRELCGSPAGQFHRPGSASSQRRQEALRDGIDIDAGTAELLWPRERTDGSGEEQGG